MRVGGVTPLFFALISIGTKLEPKSIDKRTKKDEIKELASDNVLMSAYLILQEAKDIRAKFVLHSDFYLEQLRDLHQNMLKTLQEVRDERKQLQGTVVRLMSVYERLEALNDQQREDRDQWKW